MFQDGCPVLMIPCPYVLESGGDRVVFFSNKSHPYVVDYHSVVDGASIIMYAIEIVEGKD